ncbi:MAG TPA: glycosyltransferase [Methanoregulaceae archaeon]|nr:glycosyltransferase [Methanoregulaceae archaeon]
MKIAILSCNQFSVAGGAERLIFDMSRALRADVIAPSFGDEVIKNYQGNDSAGLVSLDKKLPNEPLRQISGMRLFSKIDLDYDFFICTDDMSLRYLRHAVPHFYYVLTPRRAMYDMYYPFLEESGALKRLGYFGALNAFKFFDRRFVRNHVQNIACISHTVRTRICKIYGRNAAVIYPPVHVEQYANRPSEGFWLSVGRVDKWKRIPLQVEAFRKMPDKKLFIAGHIYPRLREVANNAPSNVVFLGTCDETRLLDLYSRCEGFITTAIDEDFGITPVEAMASGKPVVATKEGGYLETVVDGFTGILTSPTIDAICTAVKKVSEDPSIYTRACLERSQCFDFQLFRRTLKEYLLSCAQE